MEVDQEMEVKQEQPWGDQREQEQIGKEKLNEHAHHVAVGALSPPFLLD